MPKCETINMQQYPLLREVNFLANRLSIEVVFVVYLLLNYLFAVQNTCIGHKTVTCTRNEEKCKQKNVREIKNTR